MARHADLILHADTTLSGFNSNGLSGPTDNLAALVRVATATRSTPLCSKKAASPQSPTHPPSSSPEQTSCLLDTGAECGWWGGGRSSLFSQHTPAVDNVPDLDWAAPALPPTPGPSGNNEQIFGTTTSPITFYKTSDFHVEK